MNISTMIRACIALIVSTLLLAGAAEASSLVYTPINPSFGGSPSNGPMLLNDANAQTGNRAATPSALDRFQANLQSAILNNLASQIKTSLFGTNGNSITPGTYSAGNYSVTVTDNGNGTLTIVTTDNTTGASASFDVSSTQ